MYFPVKAPFYSLSLFSFLFGIQLLRDQNDLSIIYFNNWQDPNSTCRQKILETQKYLEVDNVTFSCEALETRACEQTHQRYSDLAAPESVYTRSLSCDLAWPSYSAISQEERELPLAYVMTVFSDPRNIELTLATAFRPHNSYCLHVDPKSDHVFRETMENIMGCYRNRFPGSYIYSPAQRVSVYWGHYSIVEAELICLSDLMANGRNWSYAVNMAGSEAMMFTNRELVANISANMGRLYTESFPLPEGNQFRVKYQHKYDAPNRGQRLGDHDPPPFNLTIYKGAKSWRLTRKFVTFLLNHPVAKTYLDWAKLTYIADEHVIATLARVRLDSLVKNNGTWIVTHDLVPVPRYHFQRWYGRCAGIWRNGVCVFSLADLSTIVNAQSILINKVMTKHDASIGECLRDKVRQRERLERR